MDEQSSQQEADKLAARSATALRALEERARTALAASRDQASRLEAAITSQFDEIAATIDSEQAADAQTAADVAIVQLEVDRLTKELSDSAATWSEERSVIESARDELANQVAALQAELRATVDEWTKKLADAESHGNSSETDLQAEIDRVTKDAEDARAAWLIEQSTLEDARNEATQQLDALKAELQTARDESANRLAETESRSADGKALQAEVERLKKTLEVSRADWVVEQLALEAARDELAKQMAKLQADEKTARADWAKQLSDFEEKLRDQQAAWNDQRTEWSVARATLEVERDSLQQKFDLALEDVQRYRERVGELEQDLARRPEATQADSAELVALRAERDALAERVEVLEQRPAGQIDADAEQQMADLQRRFEMAVEDVRDLKTKNAQLEAKLASGDRSASRSGDSGALDWEAQKRRLLASLEDEGDASDEPERQQERLRIENTIEMTDAVVAEKDLEIAELKSQLTQGGPFSAVADDKVREQQIRELVDADEVIAEHRKRIADIERDMEEKLRAAELELSVSRAKIARERVELDEMRADLDSKRANMVPDGAPSAPGAPKRRWLSKLGLNGEEQ